MSTDVASGTPSPGPAPVPGRPMDVPVHSTWRLSWRGVRTVTTLELRQRVRSTRWVLVLAVWTVVIGGLTALIRSAVYREYGMTTQAVAGPDAGDVAGRTMFAIIVFLVLSLGALVAPALSATSVNGDRSAGVLATLQATLLSPTEIAVGKLLAAWATALALLATASPFILWAYVEGGTPAARLLVILLLLAVMLLVVCAVGLGWSAIAARTSTSVVLTYLTVAVLGLGLPFLFLLASILVQTQREELVSRPVRWDDVGRIVVQCQDQRQTVYDSRSETIWWIVAPSPYVVVADAAPRPELVTDSYGGDDPLTAIRSGVRDLRLGDPEDVLPCVVGQDQEQAWQEYQRERAAQRENLAATWPYGLGADLLLGAAFFVATVLRLRSPSRRLPRGTRVA